MLHLVAIDFRLEIAHRQGNLDENEILIITAYEPDPEEWEADWQTRKGEVYDV